MDSNTPTHHQDLAEDQQQARAAAQRRLRSDGSGDATVAAFLDAFDRLAAGESGVIAEQDIEPVGQLPDADLLPDPDEAALDALGETVVIKLNGGLGTSMGLTGPKSLLRVKGEQSFLDLTAGALLGLWKRTGRTVPLVLMDSFATREPSLAALRPYGALSGDLPADFLQNRVPKLAADTLFPVEHRQDPELTWAPPGHGDFYPALRGSGLLDTLLERGFRYAFVSNIDNLGAVLDPRILRHLVATGAPFLMEVADRTDADRKGGHLARRREGGGLVLREIAQTADADADAFADIDHYHYFNTNNLWVDLEALRSAMDAAGGVLRLPMIVNRKTVDPTDADSSPVIQLETAMGAAVASFPDATALRVTRSRFLPVKTTSDLLVVRSDAYDLSGGAIQLSPSRKAAPLVQLGAEFKLIDSLERRFPGGPPSLVDADRLTVRGDVRFGSDVVVTGTVTVEGPATIPDGAKLSG